MIFRLVKGLVFGVIKKIITLILIMGVVVWFLFFKDGSVIETLEKTRQIVAGWFDHRISIEFSESQPNNSDMNQGLSD